MVKEQKKHSKKYRTMGRPRGINQIQITLKLDKENFEYLKNKQNRNRYINELIQKDREQ